MSEKKITEEEFQRIKEDLEDLEKYIEELFKFLPLAICTLNPLRIIIDVNQAFRDLTNYKVTEIIGEDIKEIFSEKKKIKNLIDNVQKKEKPLTKELTLITKEKKDIPVSVSAATRKDEKGNLIGYFLAIFDITEIKKFRESLEKKVKERTKDLEESRTALMNILEDIEEAKRKAEEERDRTNIIITNFTDGLLVFNKENKLSLINPQAKIFLKVKSEEKIIGKSINELNFLPNFKKLIKLLGKEMKGIFRQELSLSKDLILEITTVPMLRDEIKFGTIVILHNITREKLIEEMKTEFVSLAAHQLRTPLSAIKWTLRMLLDGDLGKITEEQRNFIEKTYRSNERMISLINDLLDVTRIEEGRYLYKPILTDLSIVVQFVVNSYQEEARRKQINLEFIKPKEKLPEIKIDVEKIRLAIQNLLDNAIRYTNPNGKVTVSLKYDKLKKEIELQVKDTGIGIPDDQQKRIFSKFFRAANVMRMETEGSGLGLFITKNIIEAHKGKIWFKSKENYGTTFYVTLPVKKEFEEFLKKF